MSEELCQTELRFRKADLFELKDVLRLPEKIVTVQRTNCSAKEGLCILLKKENVNINKDRISALENEVKINKNKIYIETTERGNDIKRLNALVKALENQVEDQTNRNMYEKYFDNKRNKRRQK